MPLIRKVIQTGTSQAVTIPPSWIREIEERTGERVTSVLMEVDGSIKIFPQERQGLSSLKHPEL
ncbi:TPA: hypothetical protein HA273_05975 [Candidatus Bathyarchaeota archaeon]|nr:hypothetical protein [Candidatus Bathyarchaeota archaeon]HIJ08974.1 hypothetical protein [Candidatus Bathyarchaeota archaeon]